MAEVIPYRFKLRGGTASEWTSANPILLLREPGVETDTGGFKLGDGVTPWVNLPYSGRNMATVLAEADQNAVTRITAEKLPALRDRVTNLELNGGGGTGYNDTQLRTDMAAGDSNTLASAQTYAKQQAADAEIRANTYTDSKTRPAPPIAHTPFYVRYINGAWDMPTLTAAQTAGFDTRQIVVFVGNPGGTLPGWQRPGDIWHQE